MFVLGCPVATSRINEIPKQVGEAALLFNPSPVEEIAAAVCSQTKAENRLPIAGRDNFSKRLESIIGSVFNNTP